MAFFNDMKSVYSMGKAQLEFEKLEAEVAKLYELIGREFADLWVEAEEGEDIDFGSIVPYMERIGELGEEMLEISLKFPAVCECGGRMEGGQYFCPQCGKDRRTIEEEE